MTSATKPVDALAFLIAQADARGSVIQAPIITVLQQYGLLPDPTGVDADVLDIEQHYRQSGGEFFAVWRGEQLVGTKGIVSVLVDTCKLRKMYLLPDARGFGLGRRLLQLAEQESRQCGYHWL